MHRGWLARIVAGFVAVGWLTVGSLEGQVMVEVTSPLPRSIDSIQVELGGLSCTRLCWEMERTKAAEGRARRTQRRTIGSRVEAKGSLRVDSDSDLGAMR